MIATAQEQPSINAERVDVLVQFTGDLEDLTAVGFEPMHISPHPKSGYTIATGTIPTNRLDDFEALEHVVQASAPLQLYPHLNYSVPETRATVLHNRSPARTGSGVVIGIIDTGVDWRHGDFVGFDERSSRVLGIWDQVMPAIAGETAGPGGRGVVYTNDQIARALQGLETVRALDLGTAPNDKHKDAGHGTHVAGIAAGDGAPATCCHAGSVFIGMAYGANLIVVRSDFADIHLISALDFIFNHPAAAGKPVVVNMSLGGNVGPHDGTTNLEMHINALVNASPGRAVVVSAGNSADAKIHASGTVPANGQIDVEFNIKTDNENAVSIDLWYDRAATVNLQVTPPGQPASAVVHGTDPAPPAFPANPTAGANYQSFVSISPSVSNPLNQDNNYLIKVSKPKQGNVPANDGWKLTLINPAAAAANFHCWLSPDYKVEFLPPVNPPDGKVRASPQATVTIPGTAQGAITVANYSAKSSWCDCFPSNQIVDSSGRGPVAKGAATNPKPDISAPGESIESANADACNLPRNCCSCCPDMCCILYKDLSGTSMSAPHVTGAIALMLEKSPNLTKAQILTYLQNSARDRPAGGYDTNWGAGKLDAAAAVDAIPGRGGGGGAPVHAAALAESQQPSSSIFPGSRLGNPVAPLPLLGSASLPPALQMLRQRLSRLPQGELVASILSRHFSEIRRLINSNSRVATMWHRANGPLWLRRFLYGDAIDGRPASAMVSESERRYFVSLYCLLLRYGSAQIRNSLQRHRTAILALIDDGRAAAASSNVYVSSSTNREAGGSDGSVRG
jgi:subtilisin family serine protease